MADRYDQMSDEELAQHVRVRGVLSGPLEVFPGRRIIEWLRDDDLDRADAERREYEAFYGDDVTRF